MLKVMHVHDDGKVCYTVRDGKDWGAYRMDGEEFIAGYSSYAAIWRAYDPVTGYEIASFRKEFYEKHIKRHRVADMVRDPDCVGY